MKKYKNLLFIIILFLVMFIGIKGVSAGTCKPVDASSGYYYGGVFSNSDENTCVGLNDKGDYVPGYSGTLTGWGESNTNFAIEDSSGNSYKGFCTYNPGVFCKYKQNGQNAYSIKAGSGDYPNIAKTIAGFYHNCGNTGDCYRKIQVILWYMLQYFDSLPLEKNSDGPTEITANIPYNAARAEQMEKPKVDDFVNLDNRLGTLGYIKVTINNLGIENFSSYPGDDFECSGTFKILASEYEAADNKDFCLNDHVGGNPTGYQDIGIYTGSCIEAKGSLKIIKKSTTGKLLNGVQFKVSQDMNTVCDSGSLYTTGSNGEVTVNDLKLGDYYVCEVAPPSGYLMSSERIKSVSVTKGSGQAPATVEFTNTPYGKLKVVKSDAKTGNTLSSFKISLYQEDCKTTVNDIEGNKVASKVTGSNGEVIFEKLPLGNYCVAEESITGNYQSIESAIGDLDGDGKSNTTLRQRVEVTEDHIINPKTIQMVNEPLGSIVIQKFAKTTGLVLAGAEFELYKCDDNYSNCKVVTKDANGKTIVKQTKVKDVTYNYLCTDSTCATTGTNSNGIIFVDDLLYGNYMVAEVVAPTLGNQGYKIIRQKIRVNTLNQNSNTCVSRPGVNKPCSQVSVEDEPIDIKLMKFEMTKDGKKTDKKLKGAIFQVHEVGSNDIFDEVIITDKDGVIVGIKPGKYIVREITAPGGYALFPSEITITIDDDGNITANNSEMVTVDKNTLTIKFYDKPSNLIISKQDILSGEELPGATLELKCEDGYEATWVSDTEPKEFEVREDVVCHFRETVSPEGYELELNELEFKLDGKGNVKSLVNLGNDSNFHVESNRVTLFNGFKVPATASVRSIITIILGFVIIIGGVGFVYFASKKGKIEFR